MLQQVLGLLARGEFELASAQLDGLLERYPEMAEAHHLAAIGRGALGRFEEALSSVDQAIALMPDNSVFHVTKGSILARSVSVDAAASVLRDAVQHNPNAFAAYVSLAHLAFASGDREAAHQYVARAARVDEESADVLILRGIEAQSGDRLEDASALFSAAVRKAPASALAHASLGLCFLVMGHRAFAEQSLRNALQIQPLNRGLRWALLRALSEQNHADQALQQLDILVEQRPNDPVALNLRADLLMQLGRTEEAAAGYRALLYVAPDHPLAISKVVHAYTALERHQDALELLEQQLSMHPERDDLWALRLGCDAPDLAVAAEITHRWFAARPNSALALEAMAQLAELQGNADQAENFADRALAISADLGAAQLIKLRAELRQLPSEALSRAGTLLEHAKTPEARRVALHWQGLALDACSEFDRALDAWQKMWASSSDAMLLPLSRPAPEKVPESGSLAATLVWTLPGAPSEALIAPLTYTRSHVMMLDRFSDSARLDGLDPLRQVPLQGLEVGSYAAWKAGAEAVGLDPARIIDWLPHWDLRLQAQFSDSKLVVLLADPRDLLLNWIVFGNPQRYSAADIERAALWLQHVLQPLLAFRNACPDRILLLTAQQAISDREGVLSKVAAFAGIEFTAEAQLARSMAHAGGRVRSGFAPGHWRCYQTVLAPAFEGLAGLAHDLGVAVE